ncbi:hypothetical protein N7495_007811 [Penicillium taxi]|uniref:uncharacterized protein n=1 Tax=Penicillium taxi TaxID=168475 RepID=UPI0025451E4E|nr:uncharacterized protein N7495_007811 [Penicillium taxi]KAJ5887770.1 hypothetical protein N7495_007811 [Penicillium taxi]
MRAKRSKKYRKLMHQYELTFGFREPYQVLVDSNFLHAVDSFKMELIPALERTLQGKPKPLLTKCSLAAIMAAQPINPKTKQPYRPMHLPPPTELPLRHCSHNPESSPIDEVECLLSLLSPNSSKKENKEHYILATAEPPISKKNNDNREGQKQRKWKTETEKAEDQALRRSQELRFKARSIPGVPIIYVKRSVMVLEPLSTQSDTVRDDVERGKFRAGLDPESATGKRKREEDEGAEKPKQISGLKKAKGPNPLSMKKAKKSSVPASTAKKDKPQDQKDDIEKRDEDESGAAKTKRRRRHNKGGAREEGAGEAIEVDA